MLNSLFRVKINWGGFGVFIILMYLFLPALSIYSYLAIIISLHQFLLLIYSIGSVIPIRYLFGALMSLQMLIGPMLAYNGLDSYQLIHNQMQVSEFQYFGYVIPAVLCFIVGLHLFSNRLAGERIDQPSISAFVDSKKNLAYIFIIVGFFTSFAAGFFSSELAFVFYLLGGFKFIGAFMLILNPQRLKIVPLIVVYGSIIVSSLGNAMFHDLIIWLFFLAIILALKFRPATSVKFVLIITFCVLATVVQLAKGDYRSALGERGEAAGVQTFAVAYEVSKGGNAFGDFNSLAKNNIRINQGHIITNIMKTVPSRQPFSNGEELRLIIEAAIMPRILAPNKLKAGDQELFMKYSGKWLSKNTSMGLSSVGDGYINFGVVGGSIFMFCLGFFYNWVLKGFHKYSKNFPLLLLFTPLVFYYPIRPDCELQTILGHLVKSCFLIFIIFLSWKKYFRVQPSTT